MKEEPPAKPRRLRLGKLHWWILALFLAICGYQAWREYDYRAAIREAKEAGFEWGSTDTFDLIRQDWRAAFRKETWGKHEIILHTGDVRDLGRYRDLIHRLRPTDLEISQCENVGVIKGLTSLRRLGIFGCPDLQNLDLLKGLTGLQIIYFSNCPALRSVDAVKGLGDLREFSLANCPGIQNVDVLKDLFRLQMVCFYDCPSLQNVDALKGLTELRELRLTFCKNIPASALRELRLALPNTDITFPDGRSIPPE